MNNSPREKYDRHSRCMRPLAAVAAWMLCLATQAMAAHPISVTESFAYVTRDRVAVKISVYVEDLFMFHNLKPNDQDFLEPDVIRDGIRKHRQFLLERFVIRDVNGDPMSGRVVDVKEFEMQPEGVPMAELMANKLDFELEYELARPPEFLTFSQHLVDAEGTIPAEMNLVIKQENSETPFGALLQPDQPQTVRLSWDNPPLSAEASEEEWESWYQKQREETLGITSYSSIYSFLYIEEFEVRHEILVPLLTLEESVLIARDADEFLDVAEQDVAREQVAAYFKSGNPIEIDGVEVKPVVDRVDFYGLDFKDFAVQAERRRVSMANARVGIILSYSTKGPPGTVKLTWDRFNRFVWTINVLVFAFDDTHKAVLSRVNKQNTYEWQSPGRAASPPVTQVDMTLPEPPTWRIPAVSLACLLLLPPVVIALRWRRAGARACLVASLSLFAGAIATWPLVGWDIEPPFAAPARVSDDDARDIFATLHKNTYRAFDYRDENDIYDALAKSADGELLEDLYLKIRRGLEMQEQGGAVSRVREVKLVEGRQQPPATDLAVDDRAFGYRARWTVNGTVQHWGHIHSRTNEYEALFSVEPRGNAWKITGLEVLDEKRLKFETSTRGM